MYNKLINIIKKIPQEYEMSSEKFWDDEHISKYMLDAHLNPDIESASRQHKFINKSADWIADIIGNSKGKELLDLGCGAGLYATAFCDAGFLVTGIDFAKRSIDYAKKEASNTKRNITYHYQNYLNIDYANQFDVITLIFCDFGVLSPSNRNLLLLKIKKALNPNGILILDVFNEKNYLNFKDSESVTYEECGFWNKNKYACIQRNISYKKTKTYLEQYIIVSEDNFNYYNIWNQAFSEELLMNELRDAGFTDFEFYDNVCGDKLSGDSNVLCVVAK